MDRTSVCYFAFCILELLLFTGTFPLAVSFPSQALAVIREKEEFVSRLADEAASLFKRRSKVSKDCECALHICNGITSQRECKSILRKFPQLCGENCKTMDLAGPTIVRTPPFVKLEDLTSEMKETICVYKNIEATFRELLPHPNSSTELIARDGHSHLYPALNVQWKAPRPDKDTGNCENYEARLTPHYMGALTGPKDVVFILDSSRSMQREIGDTNTSWWNAVRDGLASVLTTLSSFDLVSVVSMSNESQIIGNRSTLASGRRSQIQKLIKGLHGVTPKGSANHEAAFEAAFYLLVRTINKRRLEGKYPGGQKVIVYISGTSRIGRRHKNASKLLRRIQELQLELQQASGLPASVFSYSIGGLGTGAFPQQLACANQGAWFPVDSTESLFWRLTSHNTFLGANRVSQHPIWTNLRKRPDGEGWTSTVSKAFYFTSSPSGKDAVFLGVVSHSVLVKEITAKGAKLEHVRRVMMRRSRRLRIMERSPCLLQVYRNVYANGSICADSSDHVGRSETEESCVEYEGKYYKTLPGPSNWTNSRSHCEDDGGVLATGVSKDELQFLSGMVSVDGSWIGARRKRMSKPFLWEGLSAAPINISLTMGDSRDKNPPPLCVMMDNRGITDNLMAASCARRLSFVCVYEKLKHCGVLRVRPKRGYFISPPLDACINEEESLANVAPNSGSANVPSSHVLCTGNRLKEPQSLCCKRCSSGED
eukprot:g7084.t1